MKFSLALTAIDQLLVVAFSDLEGKRSPFSIPSCGQQLLSQSSQKHREVRRTRGGKGIEIGQELFAGEQI